MPPHWPLTMALASVEAEIWSATPFAAVGLVLPAGDGQVSFEFRSAHVVSVNVLGPDELPAALRLPIAHPVQVSPLSAHLQPERAVDRTLTAWKLDALLVVPIESDGSRAALFAALAESRPFEDAEVQALAELGRRIVAISDEGESIDAREQRLNRLDALSGVLRALGTALDIRDVFDQLSAIARRVLPHDSAIVFSISDDRSQVGLHALSVPEGWNLPEAIDNPYPHAMTEGWDFAIHHDLSADPTERGLLTARAGLRSALRVPIRLDGRVRGVLDFSAFQPNHFGAADLPIARRIAEYVALALSHQRLADEARQAAAVRARSANLEMLDGLLKTLAGALDVREVFDRVSQISEKVIAHDAMSISIPTGRGGWTLMVTTGALAGLPTPFEMGAPTPRLLDSHWDFELVDDMTAHSKYDGTPSVNAGLVALLSIPVWVEGRLRATVNFYSRTKGHFTSDDVLVSRRIADHIALALSHQQLAEEGRRAAALRERAANLEMLDGLLNTLAGVLDVREVFDRVSAIAQKVLPHDAMAIPVLEKGGDRARLYALTGLSGIETSLESLVPESELLHEPWDFHIVDDLGSDPRYAGYQTVQAGMQSVLSVSVRFEGRLQAAVNFFSRSKARFTRDDVLVARRIADHIALALSHQRLADEARRHEELKATAANLELLDDLLAALTDAGELREVFDRISAIASKVLAHDALTLPVLLPDGVNVRVYASSGVKPGVFPDVAPIPPAFADQDWEYDLVDDMQAQPDQRNLIAAKRGYRSALRVPIRLDGRFAAALAFLSFAPSVYKQADILVARRLADRITLLLARERGAEASRRADEASARASKLESRVRALTEELDARTGYRRVVGESPEWRLVLTQATQVASTDTTVLLLGESGTGKEVVARFLHRASARHDGPFIALNCAALPEQLLEAELFGYERGAFTGATQSKPGQLEQAGGGTLFLDEVGEMSLPAQAKFLRVLQEREFQRLGGTRVLRTDARVVAATNRDLEQAMRQGLFREDLFYRLNVFAIRLPPLRDRRADVLPLSDAFLSEIGRGLGTPPAGISNDARKLLVDYHWPGNVRELRNTLERAAILCDGGLIAAEHLALNIVPRLESGLGARGSGLDGSGLVESRIRPEPRVPSPESRVPSPESTAQAPAGDLQSMERAMVEQALQNARFNKSKAAKELGLTRAQLYVRMRRYGLE